MVLTVLHPGNGRTEELKVEWVAKSCPSKLVMVFEVFPLILGTSSLVAVHGLNGDPVKAWTHPKNGAFWLRDFLPMDVAGARVMTFGYNSNAVFGNAAANTVDHAVDLLNSLEDKRQGPDVSLPPNF